ncbi:PLP-dependent aminotransferase family protein [Bacillus sp. S/N-304-OC-R1]|uniref:MocR-like pyridoxine biosynthesis transcription factor PdxR n=1 Tax=Bacillus sp. S/N-304-OC-R1 TaxID=2758034 RepID=UPI001C8DE0F1|nr:PLP-dependent aminotransferase family protein [Bacillus sp. S/N-304-OC-R1]MBY0123584.1 PLP-dependent aminotransferase family protein [Bacillus sp. S/N-304-OC-R1]
MDLFSTLDIENSKYPYKYQTIYHFLKGLILDGKVEVGMKLPSSREMAKRYSVNRNTIKQVYEMLFADGYVSSIEGSGTFVAYSPKKLRLMEKSNKSFRLSDWGLRIPTDERRPSKKGEINFSGSGFSPDISLFPVEEWKNALYQATRDVDFLMKSEDYHIQGLLTLREAIAAYLYRTRGMSSNPRDIVIINGVMQGIGILSQLLINPGDQVIVEDPSFQSIQANFIAAGASLIHVPIEPKGMMVSDWNSRMVYVTPSHQFPTGHIMKLEERLKLLQWAKENNAIIIEDDYDSEFQRKGRPIEPLKVLDYEDRVVYLGTFAKNILPSLRIGYAILPSDLVPEFLKARNLFGEYTTSIIEQMAAANFIKTGRLERHLRKLNRSYTQKYEVFKHSLAHYQFDAFDWIDTHAGLHLFGSWKHSQTEYQQFEMECANEGVTWERADYYYNLPPSQSKVIFGFSHLSEDDIQMGIRTMSEVFGKIRK